MEFDFERDRWQGSWDGERRRVNLEREPRRRKGREVRFELTAQEEQRSSAGVRDLPKRSAILEIFPQLP